jgi:hypothetical protein
MPTESDASRQRKPRKHHTLPFNCQVSFTSGCVICIMHTCASNKYSSTSGSEYAIPQAGLLMLSILTVLPDIVNSIHLMMSLVNGTTPFSRH